MKKMMLRKLGKPVPKPPTGVRSAPPPLPAPDSSSASSLVPTTEKQFDQLINVVKVHLKPSFTPQELVSFLKSRIRHHPALTHLDFHLFRYAATLDTFRHDHNTFEWMTRSLATSDRFDSLNVLVQFMASNPCPCSDGIFSCPKTEPIFRFAINTYCRVGRFDDALFAFDSMKRLIDGKPNVALYNIIINGFVKYKHFEKALEFYEKMIRDRVKPDVISFNTLISGYCKNSQFELALEMFKEMKNKGCVPNVVSFNTLIKGFFREGKLEQGIGMAHEMIELDCELSSVTCEILFNGLHRGGKIMEACNLLIDFSRKRVLPKSFDYFELIERLCHDRNVGKAMVIVDELWGSGYSPSLIACIVLVESLRCNRRIDEACRFVERMLRECSLPDSITLNCLLRDMCEAGRAVDANKLRLLAASKGLEPDGMTYRILIYGYTKEARKEEGKALVEEMLDKGLIPDIATYNRLMDGLG
ncbi:OLC1v1034210C1 [Oldenlandia corymbosa var. corymbosa]|uniref:OLC1v1034210C1 n=1 Tax=Oldenlandia corymbosa var. corymbosa TaxID=529605 RepID=A0AAV1CSP1_OLDCO|nr:OLC1v1034210C1 [Oldenlandia corymbosa var. corymbosa]